MLAVLLVAPVESCCLSGESRAAASPFSCPGSRSNVPRPTVFQPNSEQLAQSHQAHAHSCVQLPVPDLNGPISLSETRHYNLPIPAKKPTLEDPSVSRCAAPSPLSKVAVQRALVAHVCAITGPCQGQAAPVQVQPSSLFCDNPLRERPVSNRREQFPSWVSAGASQCAPQSHRSDVETEVRLEYGRSARGRRPFGRRTAAGLTAGDPASREKPAWGILGNLAGFRAGCPG